MKSKKKPTSGTPRKDGILVCNRDCTGHEHKERKQEEHDKLFEYHKGKVVRVKFESESLKYDLNDLFKNHTFYEPTPLYSKMFDGQPLKPLEFPIKRADGALGPKEETLREQQERNNYALKNINRLDRDYNQSTWRHFKALVFNKIISDDVIR